MGNILENSGLLNIVENIDEVLRKGESKPPNTMDSRTLGVARQ